MIKDKNIMYIFCEVINQLEPESVLDIGMFFRSVGGVSRQILDADISDSIYITGVRTDEADNLNVYSRVYDRILSKNELYKVEDMLNYEAYNLDYKVKNQHTQEYDLAIMLSDMVENADKGQLIKSIEGKTKYMLIYEDDARYLTSNHKSIDIGLDEVKCRLICMADEMCSNL